MQVIQLFSFQHIMVIVCGIIGIVIMLFLSYLNRKVVPKLLAVFILLLKIGELVYRHLVFGDPISSLLPLHLCNITLIFSIFVLLFNVNELFQIAYYWSVGAIFAIATPDVARPIPDFATLSFFITHFYILYVPLCCIFILKFKPTLKGFWGSFLFLNICVVTVFFINKKLGTNYLYINRMPGFSSPLQYLGQWPYYIFVEELLYLVLTYILYLPFRKSRTKYISRNI